MEKHFFVGECRCVNVSPVFLCSITYTHVHTLSHTKLHAQTQSHATEKRARERDRQTEIERRGGGGLGETDRLIGCVCVFGLRGGGGGTMTVVEGRGGAKVTELNMARGISTSHISNISTTTPSPFVLA